MNIIRTTHIYTIDADNVAVASNIARHTFPGRVENLRVLSGPVVLNGKVNTYTIKVTGKVRDGR